MQGKYRKIAVAMEEKSEACRMWKRETMAPVCYAESYKEKRALFFRGENLLPCENYHLILMGSRDGKVEHQDFGPLAPSAGGELQYYKTFGGPELEAYDFCLLCREGAGREMEILYQGALFPDKAHSWEALWAKGREIQAFTEDKDETGARWCRLEDPSMLPPACQPCRKWMENYGHYIIGRNGQRYFLGVPGRFLQKEQPLRETGTFLLWQPIRGGEAFFERPDRMSTREQEEIFGYWIAEVQGESGDLQPL